MLCCPDMMAKFLISRLILRLFSKDPIEAFIGVGIGMGIGVDSC